MRAAAEGNPVSNLIARIRSSAADMTPALGKVAALVLAEPDAVIYQSITEVAESSKSSEASVMRFCRDLGYAGFQDFKLALAREIAISVNAADAGRAMDSIEELVDTAVTALRETERLIDRTALAAAARLVIEARHVAIFGVGASAVTAEYLAYKCTRVGLVGHAGRDAHLAVMAAASADPSAIQIIISSSGSTIDAVRVAEAARSRGCRVIGITNRSKSPLAGLCDVTFVASWPETPLTGGAFPSKISQLLIVDALMSAVTEADDTRRRMIDVTAEAVSDRNY